MMMKKYAWLLMVAFAMVINTAQAQMRYIEGRDYSKIKQTIDDGQAPKVIEFFWYGCPHCYHMSMPTHAWVTSERPKEIVFEAVPAAVGNWAMGAHLFYAAKKLKMDLDQDIFDEVHKNRNLGIIMDADKAKAYLVSKGADAQSVDKAWDSIEVKQNLDRAQKMFQASGLTGVPAYIVNGQYDVPLLEENANGYLDLFSRLSTLPKWLKN